MSTALAVVAPQWEDQEILSTIKQTVCKNATDAQFRMFIEVCRATGLNPFLKEIWYVPNVGVMAARDGYLRIANQHPQFDGMETRVERDDRHIPIKAVCTVWRKDRSHPVIAEAYYNEYKKPGTVWATYPSAMISKVAEVLALKRSFAINGVVTEEEIEAPPERGSKEAQDEYLRGKGIERQKPVPAEIVAFADIDPEPAAPNGGIKAIEMRSSAKVAEASAVLGEVSQDEAKHKGKSGQRGIIGLEKLKGWRALKDEIRSYTGTDDIYKSTLRAKGYEHCNEIATEAHAISIWKVLGAERNRLKQAADLAAQMAHASEVIGARAFADLLGVHGCLGVDDVLALGGDPLAAFLAELKEKVDERTTTAAS